MQVYLLCCPKDKGEREEQGLWLSSPRSNFISTPPALRQICTGCCCHTCYPGNVLSLSMLLQVRDLYKEGFREVLLLGQNVNSYAYTSGGPAPSDPKHASPYYAEVGICTTALACLALVPKSTWHMIFGKADALYAHAKRSAPAPAGLQLCVQAREEAERDALFCGAPP